MRTLLVLAAAYAGIQYGWPLGAGLFAIGWLAHSWFFPWKTCGLCGGDPKNRDAKGRNFNVYCPACKGSGRKRRWGARLLRRGFGQL